jgi:addiction module HigA family antidote
MLLKEFLEPMKITQQALALAIGVPYQRVNELVNQKRGINPSTALRYLSFSEIVPIFGLICKMPGKSIMLKQQKQNN